MAAPAVVGTPTETAISTASTSHVVNLPSGAAGNMFLALLSKGSAGTTPSVNALTGWTELLDEAIVLGLYAAVKVCDGTEGATTTFTLSSATRGAWIVYEISGQAATATQLPEIGTTATGSSTTPNPPSRSVTNGPKDILAIAFAGRNGEEADDDTWATAAPTTPVTFTGLTQKACGVAGTNLAGILCSASATANTATMDPGTFTIATGAWRANTIVIHPAPTAYSFDSQPGSFTVAGVANSAVAARVINAAPGSYTLTGFEAALVMTAAGSAINAEPGSFTVSGNAVTAVAGRMIDAAPGSYVFAGVASSAVAARVVEAVPGAYTLTGQAASLLADRLLNAQPGTYNLTGEQAALIVARVLEASPGAYTVTGVSATLTYSGLVGSAARNRTLMGVGL